MGQSSTRRQEWEWNRVLHADAALRRYEARMRLVEKLLEVDGSGSIGETQAARIAANVLAIEAAFEKADREAAKP